MHNMMAIIQANHHQIINFSRRVSNNIGESKLYPLIIPTLLLSSTLEYQQKRCLKKGLLKVTCVSDNKIIRSNTTTSSYTNTAIVEEPTSSSTNEELEMMMIDQTVEIGSRRKRSYGFDESREIEYLVREYGWKVRRMVEDRSEMKKVAYIQAQAFYDPSPFFDDWFFHIFQAEVLSGLIYRIRNSPPDRYACLVAEPAKEDDIETSAKYEQRGDDQQFVGVVDVTVLRDSDVLQHLEAEEYLYVSGIAVSNNYRRQKVATALLKACEVIAVLWGYEYLVLRAYEDDWGARSLYTNAGFRLVFKDPIWVTWIGRKRRILMTKQLC